MITGLVRRGQGAAAGFTALPWVREQVRARCGIEIVPGTLNLEVTAGPAHAAWHALRARSGAPLAPPDATHCQARCHAVRCGPPGGPRLPAAAVVPAVANYPDARLELLASVHLRTALGVDDGVLLEVDPWRMPALTAIIFDIDGTLVDSIPAYCAVASEAGAAVGLDVPSATVLAALKRHVTRFWEETVPADWPDRAAAIEALNRDTARRWPELVATRARVIEGIPRLIEGLRGAGVKLGIVTAAHRATSEPLLASGILDAFDAVVTGADVARRKPDPEGIALCLDRLGVAPEEAAYVGDTAQDQQSALAAGVHGFGVLTGAGSAAELSTAGAARVYASAADLAGEFSG